MNQIGSRLREIRESKGFTQEDVANKVHTTRQTISNYETGRSVPDLNMVMLLAEALETKPDFILFDHAQEGNAEISNADPVSESGHSAEVTKTGSEDSIKQRSFRGVLIAWIVLAALTVLLGILIKYLMHNADLIILYDAFIRPDACFVSGWLISRLIMQKCGKRLQKGKTVFIIPGILTVLSDGFVLVYLISVLSAIYYWICKMIGRTIEIILPFGSFSVAAGRFGSVFWPVFLIAGLSSGFFISLFPKKQ